MTVRTIAITGANRGIGYALAEHYAKAGDRVIAIVRTPSDELNKIGARTIATHDVDDPELPQRVAEALDGKPLDALLNVAGIMHWEELAQVNRDILLRQFQVNALAPLMLSAGLTDTMRDGSKIAILTSRLGSLADNTSGSGYGYRMSKAAVNMAARSLAIDLKPLGIAVGLIHPGSVKTSLNQLGGEIEVHDAVRGIVQRVDELTLETTGSYRHQNGTDLPW